MTGLQPGAATMTVLFTDLVDSTAMRGRIGDDQADEVRREHDDLIGGLVDENRGSIVKGLGDGVMAVFDAPSAGIAAAVGMQQAIARRNRQAKVPIALRMGLSVGEVRVESDDVYGTPVVEASRLCGAAGADQILAAEHVKLLAGSRSTSTAQALAGTREPVGARKPATSRPVRSSSSALPRRMPSARPVGVWRVSWVWRQLCSPSSWPRSATSRSRTSSGWASRSCR
jgi:class 3 adenylate cyclase